MTNPKPDLSELNREQLIELVKLLLARVSTLEKRVAQLEKEGGKTVKKTSQNSSVPPSRDQKANRSSRPKAKRGPKQGHPGVSRQRMEPDEIIECRVERCHWCGMDLSDRPQWGVGSHQVIDIPPVRPVVREARRYRTICPHCQRQQTADYGAGFEKGRMFGPHLEQMVLYLHYAHPLSYERVQRMLADLYGLKLSRGALVNGVKRAQTHLKRAAEVLHQQVKQAPVVGSDETTARVEGITYWQWVFQTPQLAYHVIRPSRAAQVLRDVMDDAQPEVWVSDVLSSQMCHPATDYQICLAHQVRDLQYAIDTHHCPWAQHVQTLFDDAMRLHRQRGDLDADHFQRQRCAYEQRLDDLLTIAPDNVASETLRGRFVKHRRALLLFLYRDDVPPTNNASEQALRNSVIYRKVTGGFRSDWGADLYAALISILETARRQGLAIFETLAAILNGQPVFDVPHSA
jgi:transposase